MFNPIKTIRVHLLWTAAELLRFLQGVLVFQYRESEALNSIEERNCNEMLHDIVCALWVRSDSSVEIDECMTSYGHE